VRRKT
jgi:hypothetical protein